ncbi:MAG: DUF721 domain-containing protein [Ignavibacteria bacterium]|nr:DUF721 domain-containing protein [Ignavibacteria bacterium]MBT8381493.1 DUF721 domain-containing protein [Ignavibacteria bacterium]MBT8391555.1 DUF721 domain-containing protein [Ignavibacteria bacterium]NNJ52247.1 DUF721 domain-containing protein [Ignavibacteriaceae bacterium]NNL22724.1 DUF721 domain-containing protein [Ignavibacteriaceae bacterium]
MPDGFKSIGDVFRREHSFNKLREIVKQSDVVLDFYNIFPDFKKIAQPQKVVKKTLLLKVEIPSWRNELKFKETELIEKINKFYNEERINQIRFSG